MADFLDTHALSSAIFSIIKNAKHQILLVSPYLRFSQLVYDRLQFAIQNGKEVIIVYGKSELHRLEEQKIRQLKCQLYFKENLHAKCYANEEEALITSMNLHQYSEANNEEMGVLLHHNRDAKAYRACMEQVSLILATSRLQQGSKPSGIQQQDTHGATHQPVRDFRTEWHNFLLANDLGLNFKVAGDYLKADDLCGSRITLTTKGGFINVTFSVSSEHGKRLKEQHTEYLNDALKDYSWYWSSPYDTVHIYPKNSYEQQNVNYCTNAVNLLLPWAIEVAKKFH